jgi:triacylglycerol lipase
LTLEKKDVPLPTDPRIFPPNDRYEYLAEADKIPFKQRDRDFNANNCWWLSELSLLCYERPNFIKLACRLAGLEEYRFFDTKKIQCFVANNKKVAFVVFRGTEVKSFNSISDLLIDIKFNLEDFNNSGKVHSGFKDAFESIWDTEDGLKQYINTLKKKHKNISTWFTGHSLGGAVAVLATSAYKSKTPLYTFGCPKVGDADFCDKFTYIHYRLVNGNDIIPQLPPKLPISIFPGNNYEHTGTCYRILPDGTMEIDNFEPDDQFLGFMVDNTIKVSENIFLGLKRKIKQVLKNRKLKISGGKVINNVTGTISKYYLKDITSHAPVFYSIRLWNYLADQ